MNLRIILCLASYLSCIAGVVSYHPFFFPRYQPDNYVSVHKSQKSKSPFEFKRRWPSVFDRLSMGFIKRNKDETTRDNDETKRDNDETTGSNGALFDNEMYDRLLGDLPNMTAHENTPKYSKRYFDRLSSGFIRKKRSAAPDFSSSGVIRLSNSQLNVQKNGDKAKPMEHRNSAVKEDSDWNMTSQVEGQDEEVTDSEKRGFDRLNAGFAKRPFDRLNSGFVKRPFDRLNSSFVKRPFDRLNSGFVKRPFDRLNSGFVKRPSDSKIDEPVQLYADDGKRGIDRLNYGFVKRPFDRLNSGFVKKDTENFDNNDVISEKRFFDRMNMGFIKRNDMVLGTDEAPLFDDKRGFDRLNSGFVKKEDMLEDPEDFSDLNKDNKRYFDRLTNGFVKNNDNDYIESDQYETDTEKRRFDRISNGFVKRPQDTNSSDGLQENKRYFERLNSGFIK